MSSSWRIFNEENCLNILYVSPKRLSTFFTPHGVKPFEGTPDPWVLVLFVCDSVWVWGTVSPTVQSHCCRSPPPPPEAASRRRRRRRPGPDWDSQCWSSGRDTPERPHCRVDPGESRVSVRVRVRVRPTVSDKQTNQAGLLASQFLRKSAFLFSEFVYNANLNLSSEQILFI